MIIDLIIFFNIGLIDMKFKSNFDIEIIKLYHHLAHVEIGNVKIKRT